MNIKNERFWGDSDGKFTYFKFTSNFSHICIRTTRGAFARCDWRRRGHPFSTYKALEWEEAFTKAYCSYIFHGFPSALICVCIFAQVLYGRSQRNDSSHICDFNLSKTFCQVAIYEKQAIYDEENDYKSHYMTTSQT